jgi:superfamily II DNA or RNA helicase
MTPETILQSGQTVTSRRHGSGRVEFDKGPTVIVRFEHGIEECEKSTVDAVDSPEAALAHESWHEPLWVVARIQAEAIRSVNDTWGVFSRSRIALLPHQLWVCRRVLDAWPTRWLVADDVGLGKTIEAGLILWPLLSRGTVKRLLILCPASLVGQWQYRLRTMFDIRVAAYTTGADTDRSDFWGTQPYVVASLETLRGDSGGRHRRMLDAEPWDLLIVDEAHRLNADEQGPTLGYKLVQQLQDTQKLGSMVFFTGTPHRGKNYNFLALLRLLRPELFDPRRSFREQLPLLREVMIRNNKQDVTDLKGAKLFKPPKVDSATYAYSPAEQTFYATLTLFIATGQAYASQLSESDGRAVMLVLTAMQKLASSSVAAIRRALRGRLERMRSDRARLDELRERRVQTAAGFAREYDAAEDAGDLDVLSGMDEEIVQLDAKLQLMEDEEPRLQELVGAADAVGAETKIEKILEEVTDGRFLGRTVLFFTEYKATQSLLMSKLIQRFGDNCVTFINGDERADDVTGKDGRPRTLFEKRDAAADRFNAGDVRFLVSTEAGGEGIDLQERCHSLIHVDLPWNPMRLHQRVGRLNRYGQTRRVEVLTLRNPDTVESRIWEHLNQKLQHIQQAFTGVMDEPEDIMQLVLGMTSPTLFRELFTGATGVRPESVNAWFDQKTARFGGRDVVEAVKDLVGNCSRFDFQEASSHN